MERTRMRRKPLTHILKRQRLGVFPVDRHYKNPKPNPEFGTHSQTSASWCISFRHPAYSIPYASNFPTLFHESL